ncbi:hypothetical protein K6U06_22675 [Acidiferrimicrobium sp. IK]|nr:hypothetical protein [Acidiferrimicrobium sp. IK]MCU4187185.1 hypothetical protein [Acidiferrimicrobium sp. IK]
MAGRTDQSRRPEHDALAWLTHDEVTNLRLADPRLPEVVRAALDPST